MDPFIPVYILKILYFTFILKLKSIKLTRNISYLCLNSF